MKMLTRVAGVMICLLFVVSIALAGCGDGNGGEEALLGVWTDETGTIEFEFKPDGVVLIRAMGDEQQGKYSADDGKLSSVDPDTGELNEVPYTVEGDTLRLGAEGEEATLVRKE
jgi:hypothetical protein